VTSSQRAQTIGMLTCTQLQAALNISSSRIDVSSVQEDMSIIVTIAPLTAGVVFAGHDASLETKCRVHDTTMGRHAAVTHVTGMCGYGNWYTLQATRVSRPKRLRSSFRPAWTPTFSAATHTCARRIP